MGIYFCLESMCKNYTFQDNFESLVSQNKYAFENMKTAYSQKQE